MRHTIYYQVQDLKIKVECNDDAVDSVIDDMCNLDGKIIKETDFDDDKVFNIINSGESTLSMMESKK